MQDRLSFSFEIEKDTAFVKVAGDIDIYTIPKLRTLVLMLEEKEVRFVVFELTDCMYIDSSGIGFFIKIVKRSRVRNGDLILMNPREGVLKVLQLISMTRICEIVPDRESALQKVQAIRQTDIPVKEV